MIITTITTIARAEAAKLPQATMALSPPQCHLNFSTPLLMIRTTTTQLQQQSTLIQHRHGKFILLLLFFLLLIFGEC